MSVLHFKSGHSGPELTISFNHAFSARARRNTMLIITMGCGDVTIFDYVAIGFLIACAMAVAAKLSLRAHS